VLRFKVQSCNSLIYEVKLLSSVKKFKSVELKNVFIFLLENVFCSQEAFCRHRTTLFEKNRELSVTSQINTCSVPIFCQRNSSQRLSLGICSS